MEETKTPYTWKVARFYEGLTTRTTLLQFEGDGDEQYSLELFCTPTDFVTAVDRAVLEGHSFIGEVKIVVDGSILTLKSQGYFFIFDLKHIQEVCNFALL